MNLKSYFKRIGYSDRVEPNVSVLSELTLAHATAIPFENLDVLAGLQISLNLADIEEKIVHQKRGGYCFEQNALLGAALTQIGFDVEYLSARVWYNTPEGQVPPRTHVFLRVDLSGESWLVDCGIGGSTPSDLMRMDLIGAAQPLRFETRRIVLLEGRLVPTFMHQVDFGGTWHDVYEFTGERMPLIDQAMGNWWTSTHPDSKIPQAVNCCVAQTRRHANQCCRRRVHSSTRFGNHRTIGRAIPGRSTPNPCRPIRSCYTVN